MWHESMVRYITVELADEFLQQLCRFVNFIRTKYISIAVNELIFMQRVGYCQIFCYENILPRSATKV